MPHSTASPVQGTPLTHDRPEVGTQAGDRRVHLHSVQGRGARRDPAGSDPPKLQGFPRVGRWTDTCWLDAQLCPVCEALPSSVQG